MLNRSQNGLHNKLILGIVFVFHVLVLHSQPVNYRVELVPFTAENPWFIGTSVLKDTDGFMWFSTGKGLCRYDGVNYKIFRHDPDDPGSISSDIINGIAEDTENNLLILTLKGLDRFDRYTERFDRTEIKAWTLSMLDDKKGNLWIGTWQRGLICFNKKTNAVIPVPQDTIDRIAMHDLSMDMSGSIWISYRDNRLCRFDPESGIYEDYVNTPGDEGSSAFEDRSGRFWINSTNGLYLLDRDTKTFFTHFKGTSVPEQLRDQCVYSLMEDYWGDLWICAFDGVYKYNQDLKLLNSWPYLRTPVSSMRCDASFGSLFEDDENTIWSSSPDGLTKLVPLYPKFKSYNPDPERFITNSCIYVAKKDSIYYGTEGITLVCDPEKNTYEEIDIEKATMMYEDSYEVFWIGTQNGLYRRVEDSGNSADYISYHHVPGDSSSLPGNKIFTLFEDSEGRFWIGCGSVPCFYDRANDCFIRLVDHPDSPYRLDYAQNICHETDSNELLARGIVAYKIVPPFIKVSDHAVVASDVIEIVPPRPNQMDTAWYHVSYLDSRGNLWLGSNMQGLFKVESKELYENDSVYGWTHYSTEDGLGSNRIWGIQEDGSGNFWISTGNGIARFDPLVETFTKFNTGDGIPHYMFLPGASATGPDEELYFGSVAGMVLFHPDSIQLDTVMPSVRITGFKVHNREVIPSENSVLKRSILYTDAVSLPYDQNMLTINFSVMNYVQPWKNQYKYRLDDLEKEWIYSGQGDDVTYAGLRPGKYLFRVSGSNNEGVWNEEGESLAITIHPPPWLSWWAYIIYSLLLVAIIFWYRSYLIRRAKLTAALELEHMEKEKLKELDQMKSRFFANISHEFRTPLTLLLGPIEDKLKLGQNLHKDDRSLFKIMHRNTKRLQRLINQLLDLSRLESGKAQLKVAEGDISGFSRSLALSFLSLAESRNINYCIEIPKHAIPAFYDPDILEKILTNLISNAFKFTPEKGSVTIGMHIRNNEPKDDPAHAEFRIKDTGQGIPEGQVEKIFERFYQVSSSDSRAFEGSGIGLALCRELVEMHHGKISVKSVPGKGSTFDVMLPCSKAHFSELEFAPERVSVPEFEAFSTYEDPLKPGDSIQEESGIQEDDSPVLLIVEDNADLRHYISQNLENWYQIHEAVNGSEGLEKTIENIPDLIITDLMMPGMDGMEMCQKVRNNDRTSHIPVIMVTAKADRESKIEGLETGADDYLVKPFDAEELRLRVRNMIEQKKKLREKIYKEFVFGEGRIKVEGWDERFLKQTTDHIRKHIGDPEFNVRNLVRIMGISQMQMYRKLKGSTNMSPGELIRNTRLKSSLVLLKQGYDNISQIAYQVGFTNHAYFSKCFRELYGMTPKAYAKGMIDIL